MLRVLLVWVGVLVGLGSLGRAEIPLACTPPAVAGYVPPVFSADYGAPGAQPVLSLGLFVDPEGAIRELEIQTLPADLRPTVVAAVHQWQLRPAHDLDAAAWGYRRVLLHCYAAQVPGAPTPTPRFAFDEAATAKLEAIARTIVKSWLRLRLEVDAAGHLRRVSSGNSRLDAVVLDLFAQLPGSRPHFEPARREDGSPDAGSLDLWWDFTLPSDRRDFAEVETELVVPGENEFPGAFAAEATARAGMGWLHPHTSGVVTGIFLDRETDPLLALPLLQRMSRWFIPPRNRGFPLAVEFEKHPHAETVSIETFRSVTEVPGGLRQSARPTYPKRRFLPNPDGFVRLDLTINREGLIDAWEVLEVSHERFRQPALEALAEWRFSPRTFDEQPVPAKIFLTIPFRPDR